jgi:hypothetical protein
MQRFIGFRAGPFRLAAPITAVLQIVDGGGDGVGGGPEVRSLAALLGAAPLGPPTALLAFAGAAGPVLLGCCALHGELDAAPPAPLPRTVACRWPGLLAGTLDGDEGITLVINPSVLVGLLEADRTPRSP